MASAVRAVQDYIRAHRHRPAPPTFKPPVKPPRPGRAPDSGLGHRLAGEPQLLERLLAVQPNTIAVVLPSDHPPVVRRPGQPLRPSLLSGRRPSYVVVVSTAVTRLDVSVDQLVTLDGHAVQHIRIRVGVQVSDHDGYQSLISAALLHHADLDGYLLQCVQRELTAKLKAAIGMNRLSELQRRSLQEVLTGSWFPSFFADGVLAQRGFAVLETSWPPAEPTDRETDPPPFEPYRRPERELTLVTPQASGLDLTMDARLRRLWSSHADVELLGIAGAKVSGGTTVIAVPAREPAAYEGSRLREAFGDYYRDHHLRLVAAVGSSYDDLVRAWFRQVDAWPRRLVSIDSTDDDASLLICVDQGRLPPDEQQAGVTVGRESDREALQRLLPHERVEFVLADAS